MTDDRRNPGSAPSSGPRKRALRARVSRAETLIWARDAQNNAVEYRAAAAAVASAGVYRKAVGLAILGCEDASKAGLLYLATLGVITKPDLIVVLQRDHRKKHAFAHVVAELSPLFHELTKRATDLIPSLPEMGSESPSVDQLADLGAALLRKAMPILNDEAFWLPPVRAVSASWIATVDEGVLDFMKQRALYADPPPEHPDDQALPIPGESEYARLIEMLDRTLACVQLFGDALRDESSLAACDAGRAHWPADWIRHVGGDSIRDSERPGTFGDESVDVEA